MDRKLTEKKGFTDKVPRLVYSHWNICIHLFTVSSSYKMKIQKKMLEKANCWPLCFNSIVGAEQITISRTSFLPRCQKSGAFPYQGRIWSPRSTRGPGTWRRLPPAGRRPPRGWWRCRCLPAGQLGGRSFRQSGHRSKTRPGLVQGLQPSFWNKEMLGN